MITADKMRNALENELKAVQRWEVQASTAAETRREDLLEAYRHNSRAGVFADILRKDFEQDTTAAAEQIRQNAGRLETAITE